MPRNRNCSLAFAVVTASLIAFAVESSAAKTPDPRDLVTKVVEAAGGVDALRAKNDVEYTYIYRNGASGKLDVSVERYVFDGERSWARYDVHENLPPEIEGTVVQGYDGRTTWQTADGAPATDTAQLRRADFLRKTNFYWFAMTFKLLDPGLRYSYEGQRKVGDTNYELVKITFGEGVGDVSDTYVLYIDTNTWRVDQFLFTVLDFGKTEPLLMRVRYDRVDGVLLPTERHYTASDWAGSVPRDAEWTDEISVGIRFNNGFSAELFQAP
jgi:hypothetical protein